MAIIFNCFHRGKQFRTDFSRIGKIRSLLAPGTDVMVLMATANLSTRDAIIKSLDMNGCHVVNHVYPIKLI